MDEERPPFSFVRVDGPVTIEDDPGAMLELATRIAGRYMGPERAEEFGRRNAVAGELLVRVTPERVVALAGISD